MPKFLGLDARTDLFAKGGTRMGFLPELIAENGDGCLAHLAVDEDNSLHVVMPRASWDASGLDDGYVIGQLFDDDTFREWRIASHALTVEKATVICQDPRLDLNDATLLIDSDPDTGEPIYTFGLDDATPTEILTAALAHPAAIAAGLNTWVTIGTIAYTGTLKSVTVTSGNLLAVIRAIQDAVKATGTPCEFEFVPNGTSSYDINLPEQIGSSAPTITLTRGRNLDQLTETSDRRDQVTIACVTGEEIPSGSPSGLGLARWLVGTITGAGPYVIPLTDPAGNEGPIVADGQFVGDKLLIEKDATSLTITASDAAAQTVTAATIGSLVAGDFVEFRSSAGAQLFQLEHPTRVQAPPTGYGRKVGTLQRADVGGVAQIGPNPFQKTWTTATDPPDGYAIFYAGLTPSTALYTQSKNTDPLYTEFGGASWFVEFGATNQGAMFPAIPWKAEYTGQRLSARLHAFIAPTTLPGGGGVSAWDGGGTLDLRLGLKLAGGVVHMWSAPSEVCRIVPPNAPQDAVGTRMASGVFIDLDLDGLDITQPSANTADADAVTASDIASNEGLVLILFNPFVRGTTPSLPKVYVDAYMVVVGAAMPTETSEFGGANQLHQIANLLLSERSAPLKEWTATVHDLERFDPVAFAADKLVLGASLRLLQDDAATAPTQRLSVMDVNGLVEQDTRCTFATPQTKLSNLLLSGGTSTGGSTSGGSSSGSTSGTGNTGGTTSGSGGPGSGSTGDTVTPTVSLGVTLDGSNVPTALATVSSSVVRVKIAGRTDRYPTADEVRAGTSDTSAPFSATFAALVAGATEYCAALAYDDVGNESALATAQITRGGSGTESPTPFAMFLRGRGMLKGNWGSFSTSGLSAAASGEKISVWEDQSGNNRHYWGGVDQNTFTYNNAAAPTRDGDEVGNAGGFFEGLVVGGGHHWITDIASHEVTVLIGVRATSSPPADNNSNQLWNLSASGDVSTPAERWPDTTGHIIEHAFLNAALDLGDVAGSFDLTQNLTYAIRAGGPSSASLPSLFTACINGTEVKRSDRSSSGSAFPYFANCFLLTADLTHGFDGHVRDVIYFDSILTPEQEALWIDYLNGTTDTPPTEAGTPTLSYVYAGGDVIVTASAPVADSAKIDASLSGTPTDATVRATTAITTLPFSKSFPAPTGTDVLHVKAFTYVGTSESAAATVDIPAQVGTAPADPAFVLTASDADLANSRVLTDTATITKDTATAGQVKLNVVLDTDNTLAANSDTKIASQKAVKGYVDNKLAGLSWKQAVRAATTSAHTLATDYENGDTIDGVTLATGDRILIKNQATASENGIYTVNASGAPTRATDADVGAELVNATVYVSEGTTNADAQWTCTTNAPITLGSTSLAFAQLSTGATPALDDLTDVVITSVADGDVLTYDSGSGKWINSAPGAGSGGLTLISSTTLSATASTVTFSSISGSYKDLIIVCQLRGTQATDVQDVLIRFNSDTGANYYYNHTNKNDTGGTDGATSIRFTGASGTSAPSGVACQCRAEINNYAGTTFHKTLTMQSALCYSNSGGTTYEVMAGRWASTSAITRIDILVASNALDVGSVISLYGRS